MLCIQGCNKNRAGKSGVLGQYESPWCNHISLPEVDLLNVLLTSTNTEAKRLESHAKCRQPHFKNEKENNKVRAELCTQPLLLWMIKIKIKIKPGTQPLCFADVPDPREPVVLFATTSDSCLALSSYLRCSFPPVPAPEICSLKNSSQGVLFPLYQYNIVFPLNI